MKLEGDYISHQLYEKNIRPDTDLLWIICQFDENKPELEREFITMSITDWKNFNNDDTRDYVFYCPAYSSEYADKAWKAIEHQEEIKADFDCVRSSDDQYDDPSLWSANEELAKYQEPGIKNKLFWEYVKF